MASAITDDTQNSDIDDHPVRHSPPRTSPEGRRNSRTATGTGAGGPATAAGANGKSQSRSAAAAAAAAIPHSSRVLSPLRTKGGFEHNDDHDDDRSISDESDMDIPEPAPAPPAPIQRQHPAGPGMASPRSPQRQKPPVTNPPGGQRERDTWAGQPSPSSRSRPNSFSGPVDDGRRHSASMSNGRYRHERSNGHSSRPQSGSHHPPAPSQGSWPRTRGSPTGKTSSSSQQRRSHPLQADPRLAPPEPKNQINRLESPSIAKSVLSPLQQKMSEYERLMSDKQDEMNQLDEELRVLAEKRRQTEESYLDAKAKHDGYTQQFHNVEAALRGDPSGLLLSEAQHQQAQQYHSPVMAQHGGQHDGRLDTVESFDRRPVSNAASKQSSRTKKLGTRDRIKMSLFGGL